MRAKLKIYFTNTRNLFLGLRKKVKKNWGKKSSEDTSKKLDDGYYGCISDLPLYNWVECTKGNIQFTRKDNNKGTKENDVKAWEMIYNDYIDTFGLNSLYKRMLEAIHKRAIAELDYCITGDRFKLTEAEIQETLLSNMMNNNGNGTTIEKVLIHLSKWIGHWLNSKQITAREYFDLLAEYEKYNKPNTDG